MPWGYFIRQLALIAFANPQIITTSPALTELTYQLGISDAIIAASEFSDYPEAAKTLPRIGSLFHPNIEETLKRKPDLVLLDSFTLNHSYKEALEALKIKNKSYRIDSVDTLFHVSKEITSDVGTKESDLIKVYEKKLSELKKKSRPFSFIFITWTEPAILATHSTFFSSLFETIGGKNLVTEKISAPYIPVSKEWLLQIKPDYVFILQGKLPFEISGKKVNLPREYFSRTNFSGIDGLQKVTEELWK